MEETLIKINEKVKKEKGILMYEDEVTFQVSGTISRSWQKKGKNNGLEVKQKATKKSVKSYGAVTVQKKPKFHFRFEEKFNALTFLKFLKQIVRQYNKKIFLILDNAKYHHAILIRKWLEENINKIELFFLPAYSPDLNAQEGVWRLTRRKATHNRYFEGEKELKKALFRRFNRFQGNPASLNGIIRPFILS